MKKALVSASSGGIGQAIAYRLAEDGYQVILNGRSQESVDKAIRPGMLPLVADLSTKEGVDRAIEQYPEVDVLVNNLGIYWAKEFAESTDEEWFRIFEVNVMSGVRLTRHYFPRMLQKNWGRVIFIASESGLMVPKEMIHYGFSKSAQLSIASGLAQLTRGTGVTVNSVLPGPTETENVLTFMKGLVPDAEDPGREFIKAHRPTSLLGRLIRPEEVAAAVSYVASPAAAPMNGASLRVEGGLVQSII